MKTSIKMLLVFVGIVLFLVLASDVMLWAYFKKGMNGDGTALRYPKEEDNNYSQKMTDLRPFKVIVVNTNQLSVMLDTKNMIGNMSRGSEEPTANYFKQVGDTLYILSDNDVAVYCTSVELIKLTKDSSKLNLSTFKQPEMTIEAQDDCETDLTGLEIEKFNYKGGKNNKIVTRFIGSFDQLNVQLGKYGSLYLQDITVNNIDLKADSMKGLRLDDIAMLRLKQFKRN